MKKLLILMPIVLLTLASCGTIDRMNGLINQSTESIHCNREVIERSTETIRHNGELINQSTRALEEKRHQLDAGSCK